jgi:hypothetical protein
MFYKFGNIFDLPIIVDPYKEAIKHYCMGNILDIGAGKDKIFKSIVDRNLIKGDYFSLDNDPFGDFDFNQISDIPGSLKFNFVLANQVFEHLIVEDSLEHFVN